MNVRIFLSAEEGSEAAADAICGLVHSKNDAVLGLPTGRTPIHMYRILVERFKKNEVQFKNVTTFNLDEFIGISNDHPASFHTFMNEHFFNHIDIIGKNIFFPSEQHPNNYDTIIKSKGGLDLTILGLGINGHIGFNEPGSLRESQSRVVELTEESRRMYAHTFGSIDATPHKAVTMGIRTIFESKAIILFAFGKEKANIVKSMLHEKETSQIPASLLRTHANFQIFLDNESASLI